MYPRVAILLTSSQLFPAHRIEISCSANLASERNKNITLMIVSGR